MLKFIGYKHDGPIQVETDNRCANGLRSPQAVHGAMGPEWTNWRVVETVTVGRLGGWVRWTGCSAVWEVCRAVGLDLRGSTGDINWLARLKYGAQFAQTL